MTSASPVVIGRFGKTFGILGWIKVISFTTPKENILKFKPWLIQKNKVWEEVCFEDSKQRVSNIIVKLPSYNSPEDAAHLTNINIGVLREQLPKLQKQEYYWDDLIGLEVINKEKINLGAVRSLIATGSNDVLVVMGERKRLIPYTSNVILNVNLVNKIIQVDWEQDFL